MLIITTYGNTYSIDQSDTEQILKLGKYKESPIKRRRDVYEQTETFANVGDVSHEDYIDKNPLKMIVQFLSKIQSTSPTLQQPVYVLRSSRQMDDYVSERYKYQRDGYGNIVNIDENNDLVDTSDTPDGKNVMLEMMSDPDPVIGKIRIKDAYPDIHDLIKSQLRNEYFSIPIISKQIDEATGETIGGHIDVQINQKLIDAVERCELMLKGELPQEQAEIIKSDVSQLPIYFAVSSVYDEDEIVEMSDYVASAVSDKLRGIFNLERDELLNEQAAAGRHAAILILYNREVYSVGYSTMGGKVEGVKNKLFDLFNKLGGATKGLLATRDYYIDIDPENINLQVSDVGILRSHHLENLMNYSQGYRNRGGFGYVSVGGLVDESPNNEYDRINNMANNYDYNSASDDDKENIIDLIANDDAVKEYYETEFLTNYGTQFFLPNDAYVFQASESTVFSDMVSVISSEYANMLRHYGTNCARFVQSILNDRITCGLNLGINTGLDVPSQCRRLPGLVKLTPDYLITFINLYMENNVDEVVRHCLAVPVGGKKRRTHKKTHKKTHKTQLKPKSRKQQRKSRK
jgi:hypothetical protein